MVEKVFSLAQGDERAIEKVLFDENVHYLHLVLPQGDALPEHPSNANIYMTVVRGRLSIALDGQEMREYPAGTMLTFPANTMMLVRNLGSSALELIIVKAPVPKG